MAKRSYRHPLEKRGYHRSRRNYSLWRKREDGIVFGLTDYTHIPECRLGYKFTATYDIESPNGVHVDIKFYGGSLAIRQLRDLPKLEGAAKKTFKLLRGKANN